MGASRELNSKGAEYAVEVQTIKDAQLLQDEKSSTIASLNRIQRFQASQVEIGQPLAMSVHWR